MSSDEKQREVETAKERYARRREQTARIMEALEESMRAEKAETEKQASVEGRGAKPVEDARTGQEVPAREEQATPAGQETLGQEEQAIPAEPEAETTGQEEAQGTPSPAGQEAPAQEGQLSEPPKKEAQQDGTQRRDSQQGQAQPGGADAGQDPDKKKQQDGQPFHKDDPQAGKDEKPKGLFSRIRALAAHVFHRIKRVVERTIGRWRIPTAPRPGRVNLSKDKGQEKQGRNWRDLAFHGFARRLLGRDAYMYAVQQGEKQETARQEKEAKGQDNASQTPKEGTRASGTARAGQAERTGQAGKPEMQQGNAQQQEGMQAPDKTAGGRGMEEAGEPAREQKEPEEMKGKFNSLHKIITNDLEDRYTNAQAAKEAYLNNYASQLSERLTAINHGNPVSALASRADGQLEIRINHEYDQFGGLRSFMGCSMISIKIDSHLNVTSAEAFAPTRQTGDGKYEGRKIDVSGTLGEYIVSDLAKNFREDYNRESGSYNISSRNEFEKTVHGAVEQGRGSFMIDNIPYSISVNQDRTIQLAMDAGEGKTFTIVMDSAPQQTAAMEGYETKTQELQDTERALESARRAYGDMEAARQPMQERLNQASEKSDEAVKRAKDIAHEIKLVERRMSGPYIGAQAMEDQGKQKEKLEAEKRAAFRDQQQAGLERNKAHAALDTADAAMMAQKQKIEALEQKADALREECREAKGQYDSTSLKQKETVTEAYKSHIENVTRNRESSIRVFEEILPGLKNEIGGDFKLEDLSRAMEETGRTSMEEALSAHDLGEGREEPSGKEGHEAGLENREQGAEIE